jgi:hypothetical protein
MSRRLSIEVFYGGVGVRKKNDGTDKSCNDEIGSS